MDLVDGSEHFQDKLTDQVPSLLTVILDTNPLAWALLEPVLPLSTAVANLLVFINAHLASSYTNRVAVIASHCDRAEWLYPTPTVQLPPRQRKHPAASAAAAAADPGSSNNNNNNNNNGDNASASHTGGDNDGSSSSGSKYRPFRLIEAELITNLKTLLSSTTEASLSSSSSSPSSPSSSSTATATSTHIAGALTLALSYINRLSILYTDSVMGPDQTMTAASNNNSSSNNGNGNNNNNNNNTDSRQLQSRILLVSVSPSTDLAHQYIPIMNAVFACQRLNIPIDILQIRLPGSSSSRSSSDPSPSTTSSATVTATATAAEEKPTVFLQQASDATSGIFITFTLPSPGSSSSSNNNNIKTAASQSLLTYLLTAFVTSPSTRELLTPPTAINVDFRAACFCHRRVIDLGYVCSICLSIFCEVPPEGVCLTCGNKLQVPEGYGKRPVVVARKKKKKRQTATPSAATTPVATAADTSHNSR